MRVARIPIAIAGSFLVAAMLVLLAPMAEASTSVSYPGGCAITLSQVTATAADQLTVSASGYPVGAVVTFTLHSQPYVLGHAVAVANGNGTGTATLSFHLPANITTGMHTITATGTPAGQCDPSVSTNLMVSANTATTAAPSTGGGTLPRTGTNSALLFQVALILIALGGLVTLAARKRLAHARVES
jgi:LPXTG-motif cell wall-anchored protein